MPSTPIPPTLDEFNGDVAAWYAANSAFKHAGVGDGSPVPRKTAPANRRLDSRSQTPASPAPPAEVDALPRPIAGSKRGASALGTTEEEDDDAPIYVEDAARPWMKGKDIDQLQSYFDVMHKTVATPTDVFALGPAGAAMDDMALVASITEMDQSVKTAQDAAMQAIKQCAERFATSAISAAHATDRAYTELAERLKE